MVDRIFCRGICSLVLLGILISVLHSVSPAGGSITTILIVRHAEKDTMQYDPPLTQKGWGRARMLTRVLENAEAKALYVTQFVRTQQTLQLLADKLGIKPTIIEVSPKNIKGHIEELVKSILTQHSGETVVIASHSNVIPSIIEALGASPQFEIADEEYDNLFVVTINSNKETKLLRLKFGTSNP
jgi:broad specificity phosphatase PhoE